jgi:hypothetical protein
MIKFTIFLLFPFQLFAQNFSPKEIAQWKQQAKNVSNFSPGWCIHQPTTIWMPVITSIFKFIYKQYL